MGTEKPKVLGRSRFVVPKDLREASKILRETKQQRVQRLGKELRGLHTMPGVAWAEDCRVEAALSEKD